MRAGFITPPFCAPLTALATWLKDLLEIVAVEVDTILVDDICRRKFVQVSCCEWFVDSLLFQKSNRKRDTRNRINTLILRIVLQRSTNIFRVIVSHRIIDLTTAENIAACGNNLSALASHWNAVTTTNRGGMRFVKGSATTYSVSEVTRASPLLLSPTWPH